MKRLVIAVRLGLYLGASWLIVGALANGLFPHALTLVIALAVYTTLPIAVYARWRGWPFYPKAAFRLLVVRPFWYTQLMLPLRQRRRHRRCTDRRGIRAATHRWSNRGGHRAVPASPAYCLRAISAPVNSLCGRSTHRFPVCRGSSTDLPSRRYPTSMWDRTRRAVFSSGWCERFATFRPT